MTEKSKEKMINVAALSAHFKEALKPHFDKMVFDNEFEKIDQEYDKNIAVKRDTIFDMIKFQHLMEKIRQDTIKNGPQMPMPTRILPKFKEDENVEYQAVKEPQRKVFSVDVGDINSEQVKKYLDQVKDKIKSKSWLNGVCMRDENDPRTEGPYSMHDDQGIRDHIKNVAESMTPAKIAEKILSTPVQLGKKLPEVHDAGYYYAPYIPQQFRDDLVDNPSKDEITKNILEGVITSVNYENKDRKCATTYNDGTVITTYEPFKTNVTSNVTSNVTGNLTTFNSVQGTVTQFTAIAGTTNATTACNSYYYNNQTSAAVVNPVNITVLTPKGQTAGNPYGYYSPASLPTGPIVAPVSYKNISSYFYHVTSGKESISVELDDGLVYTAYIEPNFDELTPKHNFQIQKLLRLVQQSYLTHAEAYAFMKDNWIQQHFKITTI